MSWSQTMALFKTASWSKMAVEQLRHVLYCQHFRLFCTVEANSSMVSYKWACTDWLCVRL